MRSALFSFFVASALALSVVADDAPPAPPDSVHVGCGQASAPVVVPIGTRVRLGSFATFEEAVAAESDPQFRGKLRAKLALTVHPYSTCDWRPPQSTKPKCSGMYRAYVGDVVALEYSVVMNPDGSFAVELEVIGSISYSLECGICTPQVQ